MPTAAPIFHRECSSWHRHSWKNCLALQQPYYENVYLLNKNLEYLSTAPAIVSENEILSNLFYISEAAKGNVFILQAGDCAETFDDCQKDHVQSRVLHLHKMAEILANHINKPVIIIGRIAGQYAKPRSETFETIQGTSLICYRGDIINDFSFHPTQRKPDPQRIITAYLCSQKTAHWIRGSGISSLPCFYSHEALLLDYETAFTRFSEKSNCYFNIGAHFLWLGERTKQITGAHVEYLRGIENPIGIKLGATTDPNELVTLINTLNPQHKEGRITLITRLGEGKAAKVLPALLQKVKRSGQPATWMCDPMHGNTKKAGNFKTRSFSSILNEFQETLFVHKEYDGRLAGVHLEVSPDNVTECLGGEGRNSVTEKTLPNNYLSRCDPRLNREQSLELANRIGEII